MVDRQKANWKKKTEQQTQSGRRRRRGRGNEAKSHTHTHQTARTFQKFRRFRLAKTYLFFFPFRLRERNLYHRAQWPRYSGRYTRRTSRMNGNGQELQEYGLLFGGALQYRHKLYQHTFAFGVYTSQSSTYVCAPEYLWVSVWYTEWMDKPAKERNIVWKEREKKKMNSRSVNWTGNVTAHIQLEREKSSQQCYKQCTTGPASRLNDFFV